MSPAGTTSVYPALYLNFSSGVYIDLTLRIGMPQMEQGASMSSIIRTTSATATRTSDVLTVNSTSFSSIYNEIARSGAVYIDAVFPPVTATNFGVFSMSNNNSFTNSSYLNYSNSATTFYWSFRAATPAGNTTTLQSGRNKLAAAWTSNTIKTGLNGAIIGYNTSSPI